MPMIARRPALAAPRRVTVLAALLAATLGSVRPLEAQRGGPGGGAQQVVAPGMPRAAVLATFGAPAFTRQAASGAEFLFYRNGCERRCGTFDVVILDSGVVRDAILRSPRRAYAGESSSPEAIPATVARRQGFTPPPRPVDPNSLYARLGGAEAIAGVVHWMVLNIAADTRINRFFAGVDLPRLERLLTEQLCNAAGGPCRYTGRSMEKAHQGLQLTAAHFTALVEDLQKALDKFQVPAREQQELLAALAPMQPSIIGK